LNQLLSIIADKSSIARDSQEDLACRLQGRKSSIKIAATQKKSFIFLKCHNYRNFTNVNLLCYVGLDCELAQGITATL